MAESQVAESPTDDPHHGLLDTSVVIDLDRIDSDLLPAECAIAATAAANDLPLYTRNPKDFTGLDHLVTVRSI